MTIGKTSEAATDLAANYIREREAELKDDVTRARHRVQWTIFVLLLVTIICATFGAFLDYASFNAIPLVIVALTFSCTPGLFVLAFAFWRFRKIDGIERIGRESLHWLRLQLSAVLAYRELPESAKMIRITRVYVEEVLRKLRSDYSVAQRRLFFAALATSPFIALVFLGMALRFTAPKPGPLMSGSMSDSGAVFVTGLMYSIVGGVWVLIRLWGRNSVVGRMRDEEAALRRWVRGVDAGEGRTEDEAFQLSVREELAATIVRDHRLRMPLGIACLALGFGTFIAVFWWVTKSPSASNELISAVMGFATGLLQLLIGALFLRLHHTATREAAALLATNV